MPTSKEAARQETPRSSGQAEQLRFWRGYLDGAPAVLHVPADHRRPSGPGRASSRSIVMAPESATEQMSLPFDYVVSGSFALKFMVR